MDEQATWELLERLGAVRRGHFEDGEWHADMALEAFDPLADPNGTQALARALAAALPKPRADVVLVWAGMPSMLLGFLVGIALDRRVVRLADDEGVVYASGPLGPGQRAVLVGDALTPRDIRLARAFVESRGASLACAATLIDDGRGGEAITLVSLKGRRFPAEDCPLCRSRQPLQVAGAGRSEEASAGRR